MAPKTMQDRVARTIGVDEGGVGEMGRSLRNSTKPLYSDVVSSGREFAGVLYEACLSQSGTSAPVVLNNNEHNPNGYIVTFGYSGVGVHTLKLSVPLGKQFGFNVNKVRVYIGNTEVAGQLLNTYFATTISNNELTITFTTKKIDLTASSIGGLVVLTDGVIFNVQIVHN